MQTTFATARGTGTANEDMAVCGPSWAIILDGATHAKGVDSGCIHDVPWLVRHLAASMVQSLMLEADMALTDVLAEAIRQTCKAHADTCDLSNPDSPSSTAAMIRQRGEVLDYLVLGDSPVILRHGDMLSQVIDNRNDYLPGGRPYSVELVRRVRNTPEGFWVASTNVQAAYEALSGSSGEITSAALLTDGITRLIDFYGATWDAVYKILTRPDGPSELIRRVRLIEDTQGVPFGKLHDDATAIYAALTP